MSLLANELDVRGVLHGQVSFVAVNQTHVIHDDDDKFKFNNASTLLGH